MKDNVDNRRRITFGRKVRIARLALAENGLRWCFLMLVYYTASHIANRAFGAMDRLRQTHALPGLNSRALNKEIWEAWDWSAGGEEWNSTAELKDSFTRGVLEKYVPRGGRILEIGPGGGRWTGPLLERADEYLGIDISATCIQHCRQRFSGNVRARFEVGSGVSLAAAADASIDTLWSCDVFVHINRAEVELYAAEFRRVMRAGAVGIIHHGGIGGSQGGWRSDLTAEGFADILRRHDLKLVQSFTEWRDGESLRRLDYDDVITVFMPA
jgi:SAM-dependent methyltransferase